MPQLPELDPVFDPVTGLMTTAVPVGTVQGLPKVAPAPNVQPQPLPDPYAGLGVKESVPQSDPYAGLGVGQPLLIAPAQVSALPQDPYAGLGVDQPLPIQPALPAPLAPAPPQPLPPTGPVSDPGFLQKSVDAWKVGWAQYASQKLRGVSVLPGVRDEWLMQKADQLDALVDPETVQRVNELTGGQLQMTDFWGIVKQLPKIGWYGMIQNAPQMFDAMVAFKVGGALGGSIGGIGGPKGKVIGNLLGGHAAGVASAALTESGSFKQSQMQDLRAAGVDEATANMLADKYARMYGPAAGVVEYASNIFQLSKISIGMRKSAIDVLKKTPIWKLMLSPLTGGLSEGGEELSQGWLSQQATNLMWDEAEKITGRKFKRPEAQPILPGGVSGFAIGTMMGAMGLPVSISSKMSQNQQAAEAKVKDATQYKTDLRANLVSTLGVSAEVVDKSGVVDKMAAATDEAQRTQVLNDFAEQNLAGEVAPVAEAAPTAAEVDVAPKPPPVVLPAVTPAELAEKPPDTRLPPLVEVKPAIPSAPVVPEPTIPPPTPTVAPLVAEIVAPGAEAAVESGKPTVEGKAPELMTPVVEKSRIDMPDGMDAYYDDVVDTIYVSKDLSPTEKSAKIRHEQEHALQSRSGILPTSKFEGYGRGFVDYLSDPAEVAARAVETGEKIPEIWNEVFRLREEKLAGKMVQEPLVQEKVEKIVTERYAPATPLKGSLVDWHIRRLTHTLRSSDPKPIKEKVESLRIYLANKGNGVEGESQLQERGFEATSSEPYTVDVPITQGGKLVEKNIKLIESMRRKLLPEPIVPPPTTTKPETGKAVEPAITTEVGATGVISTEGKPDIQQAGSETRISGTRGESFPATYAVVPRESLIASHDPITFAKNPLYPLVNPRDYSSEGEQAKVLTIRKEFRPDEHVTDATSAAVGPVMAAHVTDENDKRQLVVLGGNTREMVTQSMTPAQKVALADFTNKRADRFGIEALPDADHELIRYMGKFDLREKGVRDKLQATVDSLNPSPGREQNIMMMAEVDASTNIKFEHLAGLTADITPEDAQAKVKDLIAGKVIDRDTRGRIADHPAQAQEYLRRVLVNAAFRNPVLAEFAARADRETAAGRGLVESAAPAVIEMRRKGHHEIADAFGRMMAEVTGYMSDKKGKKGDTLQVALKKAAQQTNLDKRFDIVLDIVAAMRPRIVLGTKGAISTDETIANFASFFDRVRLAVEQYDESDMFGDRANIEDVIRTLMGEIQKEQKGYQDEVIRGSRRRVDAVDMAPMFTGFEAEVPRELLAEMPAVIVADETTQPELFAIQRIAQLPDSVKSTNMAEELYGGSERAMRILRQQLAIINADPLQKTSFPQDARERLKEVFSLLEQRILDTRRKSLAAAGEIMPTVKAETAQSVVNQFTKKWRNKPKGGIIVLQSEEDLDALNLPDESMQAISDFKFEGFTHLPTDTVYIIADNLERTSDVIRVTLHEATIHSGLRHVLGVDFESELEKIGADIPETDLTDIALRYELDLSRVDDRLEAIEEYLGKYAPTRNPTLYQRFLAAIRRALRAMGINEHLIDRFDKRGDIDKLVDAGREYMERGRRLEPLPRGEGTRLSRIERRDEILVWYKDQRFFVNREYGMKESDLTGTLISIGSRGTARIQLPDNAFLEVSTNDLVEIPPTADFRFSLATRVAKGVAREDIDESRFLKRALLKEEFTPDDRMEIVKYMPYEIQHNPETKAEVLKIIADKGPNEAENMFYRNDQAIIPAARIPLGATLRNMHIAAAEKTENVRDRYAHHEAAYDIIRKMADILLESGQTSQSAAMVFSDEMLETPGGAEFMVTRMVHDAVRSEVDQLPVTIPELKRGVEKARVEDTNEALIAKGVQEGMAKILHRLGTTERNGMPARLRNADNQIKLKAAIADAKRRGMGKEFKFAVPELALEEKIAQAAWFGVELLANSKTLNYGDFSAQMKARYGEGITPLLERVWDESAILAGNIMRGKVQPLATVGVKAAPEAKKPEPRVSTMTAEANRLVREWIAAPMIRPTIGEPTERRFEEVGEVTLPTQKTIINSLVDLGMTEREGFKFITDVQREAAKRAQAKKEKRLQQLLKGQKLSPENQSAIDRILEISAIRRLDDAEIMDIFAEKMGLPKLTPELAGKLQDLAEKIRQMPVGLLKNNAIINMLNFMRKQMPITKTEKAWSIWYANILSGYQTQERNLAGNFWSLLSNLGTSMIVDPKNARFAVAGFFGGASAGGDAFITTITTGVSPIQHSGKFGPASVFELDPFSGPFRFLNNWKYVGRTLDAFDALFFIPIREARARMLMADMIRDEGYTDSAALWEEVERRIKVTDSFRQQAVKEGAKGHEVGLRALEIAEQGRPEKVQEEAKDYSTRALFRNEPEGLAGVLARMIKSASRHSIALKAAVPFTNIVANVTNFSLDHSPIGFVRAIWGIKDAQGVMRPITGHRRAQLIAKATMGTAAMLATYLMAKQGGDDDDVENKIFDVYGAGPRDFNKRAQWLETGAIPWSIRWGKRYYDIRLTPLAIPIAIIGSIRDHERWNTQKDENTLWELVSFATLNSSSVIFDMSFISGINQIMTMLDPGSPGSSGKKLRSYLLRHATSVIPNLFRQLDRTFDSEVRDNASIKEALIREIPIVSRLGRPKINRLGEPIYQATGPISIFTSRQRDKPLWQLIVSKEAWISDPNDSARVFVRREKGKDVTRKMTDDESYRYAIESGQLIRDRINQNLTFLQGASKEIVQKRIKWYVQHARERVKRKIRNDAEQKRKSK